MNYIGANFVITEGYVVIFFKNMSPFIYHTKNVFGEGCYGTTFTVKNLIEECTVDIRLGLGVDIYCHSWYSGNKEKSVTVYIPQNYKRCVYSRYIQVRDNDGTVIRKPLFRAIADAFIKTNEAIEKDFIEQCDSNLIADKVTPLRDVTENINVYFVRGCNLDNCNLTRKTYVKKYIEGISQIKNMEDIFEIAEFIK